MSEIRKKAMTRLVLCAVALVASIIFSVLLLSGTFDGKTGGSQPASGDTISSSAPVEGVDDPTADSFTAESASAEEVPAEPEATPEPTPEPTPVPARSMPSRFCAHIDARISASATRLSRHWDRTPSWSMYPSRQPRAAQSCS